MNEKYCVKKDNHQSSLRSSFENWRSSSEFADVTLAGDDLETISAHRLILSSTSGYFRNILQKSNHHKMLVCIDGITVNDLEHLLDFMYFGEVQLEEDYLERFMSLAKKFQIEGLSGYEEPKNLQSNEEQPHTFKTVKQEAQFKEIGLKNKVSTNSDKEKVNLGTFSDTEELDEKIHAYIIKNDDRMLACFFCGKSSRNKRTLTHHVETHLEGLSFQCNLCGDKSNQFKTRNSLNVHKYTYHINC